MISSSQADKINELIDRYQENPKLVTKTEIMDLGNTLSPNSPKTGKPITFGSFASYAYRDLPSHLNKHELMVCLAMIVTDEKQIQKHELGFFSA